MTSTPSTTKKTVPTMTVKKAYETLDKWQAHKPYIAYNNKREAAVLYDHELACVQIGTIDEPVYCPFGVSHWSASTNTFKSVQGPFDTQWAWAEQVGQKRKTPGGKSQIQLTMHGHDKPGTQGFYANAWINGVIDNVINGLVHGVPDPQNNFELVDAVEDKTGLPSDPEQQAGMYRRMLTTPIQPSSDPQYAPQLKVKVKYAIEKKGDMDTITLPDTEVRVYNPDEVVPEGEQNIGKVVEEGEELNYIKEKVRGVWVVKVNPLQMKKNEINMTLDVIVSMIVPAKQSAPPPSVFKGVGFASMDAE